MRILTILPIKPFAEAKTRLSPVLSPEQRVSLSRRLFARTLRVVRQASEVVVISRSARVRRLAKEAGAWALVEANQSLNAALQQAARWAICQGVEAVLILPGDLPLLQVADVRGLMQAAGAAPSVVIAPCHRAEGTNALLLHPPDLLEFAYGPDSFTRHRRAAEAAGVNPVIYRSPTLALDLDRPEDWARLHPAWAMKP